MEALQRKTFDICFHWVETKKDDGEVFLDFSSFPLFALILIAYWIRLMLVQVCYKTAAKTVSLSYKINMSCTISNILKLAYTSSNLDWKLNWSDFEASPYNRIIFISSF